MFNYILNNSFALLIYVFRDITLLSFLIIFLIIIFEINKDIIKLNDILNSDNTFLNYIIILNNIN